MNKYTIRYGESIFDVSINIYGKTDYVVDLILLNPILENISNTDISGIEINYEPIVITDFKPVETTVINNTKNVTIRENQSIFDVCLQVYGNIENVFTIVKNSTIDNINETNIKGVNFSYEYNKTKFAKYFLERSFVVSTLNANAIEEETGFLLQENGFYILQENGFRIKL